MQETTSTTTLIDVCQRAVDHALRNGAEDVEIFASDTSDLEISLQSNDLDQVGSARETTFGIRVFRDGRQGFATTNRSRMLSETAAEAIALARASPPDPLAGLPESSSTVSEGPLCEDPAFEDVETEDMVKLAMALHQRTMDRDRRLTVDRSEINLARTTQAIVNSRGIARGWRGTTAGGAIFGMAIENGEVGSFAYDGAYVRHLEHLEETLDIAFSRFAEKAIGALGAQPGESFRGSVLLPPDCVAEFLVPKILTASSARNVRLGQSPLVDRIGTRIACSEFGMVEAGPGLPEFPLRPFDREGQSRAPMTIIEDGVLRDLLHDSYEGRAAGRPSTAHAIGNAGSLPSIGAEAVEITAGNQSLDKMKQMDRGVILTRFSGSYNAASGDFSGVVKGGFLVVNGKKRPIQETTISGNIWTALQGISGISEERELLYGTRSMPWIRLEDISVIAGQSG